jgi:Resolvase, N terminal domain
LRNKRRPGICKPSFVPLGLQSHAPASSSSRRRPRRVTRFVVYLRVSTLRQGASGLGIEAQREAVARHVASTGGRILAEVVETESGKQSTRPELARALAVCRGHRTTLLIAKLDRLARNVQAAATVTVALVANRPAMRITRDKDIWFSPKHAQWVALATGIQAAAPKVIPR